MPTKTLILVRHGQYHKASETETERERLTDLGRKQAKYASKRLRENKIHRILHSTMPRAEETAKIIKEQMGYRGPFESTDLLRECVPGYPKALRKKAGFTDLKMLKKDEAQAERAFRKYFKASRKDRLEVLVCHGNIIRFFVCKVMKVDTILWRTIDIKQCGITIIEIRSKGRVRQALMSHNETGHIPKNERTFM